MAGQCVLLNKSPFADFALRLALQKLTPCGVKVARDGAKRCAYGRSTCQDAQRDTFAGHFRSVEKTLRAGLLTSWAGKATGWRPEREETCLLFMVMEMDTGEAGWLAGRHRARK